MSKEFLLGLSFREQKVTIDGTDFIVKEMNAETANKYESSLYKIQGQSFKYDASEAKVKLLMFTLHDLDGKRVFEDKDLGLVKQLPAHVVDLVFDVASNLNNLNAEETEKN